MVLLCGNCFSRDMNFSSPKLFSRGFTLIEAVVTIGVFMLMTSISFMNYRSVDNTLLLSALANKVAISIRQAQVSGTSVRENVFATNQFTSGYGIHFLIRSVSVRWTGRFWGS